MRRTGNYLLLLIVLMLASITTNVLAQGGQQQGIDVEASLSESSVHPGERVSLQIEISGKNFNSISRPQIPQIRGFRLVSNTPSTSRSYRFVNGESSVSYTYTYYLVAENTGNYNIPPISLKIDGENRSTGPLSIKVTKRPKSSEDGSSNGGEEDEIFLDMEVNTRTPVPGEQVVATVVLYFREDIQVTSFQPVPGWKAEGFWKEKLKSGQPETDMVVRDGLRYKKAELAEYALFPTRSGNLTISPYKVAFAVRVQSSGRDPFSSFFGARQKRIELKTDPVKIDVADLPPLDDALYLGAVGNFEVHRSINMDTANVGETVELTTRINGRGNIPLINKPNYNLPNSFETYAPRESSSINKDGSLIKGEKTFTDVLVPRKTGNFTIPAVKVAFYNPERQDYNVKFLPALQVDVKRTMAARSTSTTGGIPIQPVSGTVTWHRQTSTTLVDQWWFWAALALPPLFLLVGFWQKKYRERLRTDRDFARYEHAWSNARERLQQAKNLADEQSTKEVYSTLHQTLTLYISDKLSLSEAGLSDEAYLMELENRDIPDSLVASVRSMLQKCATIRYAPNPTDEDLLGDIEKTEEIIKKLRKRL